MSITNLSFRSGKLRLMALLSIVAARILMAQATSVPFTRYGLPSAGLGITSGPDGALWFTEGSAHKIGRITTDGLVAEYQTSGAPYSIVAGSDGALWFTENSANGIGRITTDGVIAEYSIPCCGIPNTIAAGSDGALWFTEVRSNRVGRISTDGVVTEYPLPNPDARSSNGIAAGPDGALWFSEDIPGPPDPTGQNAINKIGRITTAGEVTDYALPPSRVYQGVFSIAAGSDGAMWFTEFFNGIGRIGMDGVVTEFNRLALSGSPAAITAGPDGALWFTESSYSDDAVNTIGRITTAGEFTEYQTPAENISFGAITTGPDGAVWFTDAWWNSPSIMRVNLGSDFMITTTSLPDGIVGVPYSANLTAQGGAPPYMWSITPYFWMVYITPPLPAGLGLDPATGAISGTPTRATADKLLLYVLLQDSAGQLILTHLTISIAGAL